MARLPLPGVSCFRAQVGVLAFLATAPTALGQVNIRPHPDAGIPVAKVSFLDGTVEVGSPDGRWTKAAEGARVRTGDRVRTDDQATVRVEFPFMSVIVGPSSIVGVSPSQVL